jgi:hypothetical protein
MSMPLTDPSLPSDDPRQVVYALSEAVGLAVLLIASRPIEQVLAEAVLRAPILTRSSPIGPGLMQLDADPDTMWVAVESPAGSAVIVFASPESNTSLILNQIMIPFESSRAPFSREVLTRGSGEPAVIALLDDYDVVAVSEFPLFRSDNPAQRLPVMPITARRAARHWQRVQPDLYTSTVTQPAEATVFLIFLEGQAALMTQVGEGEPPSWTSPLVAAGTHRIEIFESTVTLAKQAPILTSSAQLDAEAQQLVEEVHNAFERARSAAMPPAPSESTDADIWTRVGRQRNNAVPSRPWVRPSTLPPMSYVERVRDSAPGSSSFDQVNERSLWLRQRRQTGFEYAWRTGTDALLSPTWVTLRSMVADPASGNVVAAGHLTHECWGLPPAHDLGAIDGRNLSSFPNQGHPGGLVWPLDCLYVGSLNTGVLVPLDATLNVMSVDLHGPSGEIGVLHHLGSSTAGVSVIAASGERRLLTILEGISGTEPVRFSNDGTWLLVSRSRDSVLVEISTGRWIVVDVANTGWWPGASSTLVSVYHEDGRAFPALFDLAGNGWTRSFPDIELDVPLLETFPYVWHPTVSADCSEMIAASPAGVSVAYQEEHGTGSHLVRVTLATGNGRLVVAPFLDGAQTLERDISDLRWLERRPSAEPVVLHPDLRARLQAPTIEHEWVAPGRWADQAEQVLVTTLNAAINLTKRDEQVSHLMPEILAYLIPVAHDPAVWGRQAEWLVGLSGTITELIMNGRLRGPLASAWRHYTAAIAAVQAGRSTAINPIAAGWVTTGAE